MFASKSVIAANGPESLLTHCRFCPSLSEIICCSADGVIKFRNVETLDFSHLGDGDFSGQNIPVSSLHVQGALMVTCHPDGCLKLWNIRTRKLLAEMVLPLTYPCAILSVDGNSVIVTSGLSQLSKLNIVFNENKNVYNIEDLTLENIVSDDSSLKKITTLDLNDSGDLLAIGGINGNVSIASLKNNKLSTLHTTKCRIKAVKRISFSPDAKLFASISSDTRITVHDSRFGQIYASLIGCDSNNIICAISTWIWEGSNRIAACSINGCIKVWDLNSKECIHTVDIPNPDNQFCMDLCFIRPNKLVVSKGSDLLTFSLQK